MHNSTLSPPKVTSMQGPRSHLGSLRCASAVLPQVTMQLRSYWGLGGEAESGSRLCCTPPALTFQQWGPSLSEVAAARCRVWIVSAWGSLASDLLTWWVGSVLAIP